MATPGEELLPGDRVVDERVEAGYAANFALGIIVKILLVKVIVAL